MASINKQIVIGSVVGTPNTLFGDTDNPMLSFQVNVSASHQAHNKAIETVERFQVEAWGQNAKLCSKYLTRGQEVYIEGPALTKYYIGEDNAEHPQSYIELVTIQFLGGIKKPTQEHEEEPQEIIYE